MSIGTGERAVASAGLGRVRASIDPRYHPGRGSGWSYRGVVKSCKLIMGSGNAIPSKPPSLALETGERGGGEDVVSIPLVGLSEAQAAAVSMCRP